MKLINFFFLFGSLLLMFLSCQKEKDDPQKAWFTEEAWQALQQADFGCSGINSDYFFSADLDGLPFCMNATGKDTSYFSKAQTVVTSSTGNYVSGYLHSFYIGDKDCFSARLKRFSPEELAQNGELENEVEFIVIYSTDKDLHPHVVLDSFLKTGIDYPLNKTGVVEGDPSGQIYLSINLTHDVEYLPHVNNNTAVSLDFDSDGDQPDDAFLRCTGISKEEFDTYWLYDVSFEFAGNMYVDKGRNLWRKLTDGKMKAKFKIEK